MNTRKALRTWQDMRAELRKLERQDMELKLERRRREKLGMRAALEAWALEGEYGPSTRR